MKTCIGIICLLAGMQSLATELRWDGQGEDGQWSNPLNWDQDHVPNEDDTVILDNTWIAQSYTVILPEGNTQVRIVSLRIFPAISFNIECILPATNSAAPALVLTGTGDAFVLEQRSVFRNRSGASSGTPVTLTANGSFRISNGGRYIHQTPRGHTDFLVSRLSAEAGTEDGIFEFDVPGTASYTVSVSGRVFGTLVFSASGGSRTYTGAGISPVHIRGQLIIGANTTFSYGANTSVITVEKNCVVNGNGVLNIANGGNDAVVRLKGDLDNNGMITETGTSAASRLVFCGSTQQLFTGSGVISQQVKVAIDNIHGLKLNDPLNVPYQLEFVIGKIYSSYSGLLSFGVNALCTGASESGFAEGPVRKAGSNAFEFPVGAGSIYAPITIGPGSQSSDEFTAEYRRNSPQSVPGLGGNTVPPIDHISYVEYWNLLPVAGNSPRKIVMNVSQYSFAYELQSLVVARFNNGRWTSEGGNDHLPVASSAPYVSGTFASTTELPAFGAFTVGSIVNQQVNPLPVLIEFFNAKVMNGHIELGWQPGICPVPQWNYQLMHAKGQDSFSLLASIPGDGSRCGRVFIHRLPAKGKNRYILNVVDRSGDTIYRKHIEAFYNPPDNGQHLVSVSRVQQDGLELDLRMPDKKVDICIISGDGRIIFSRKYTLRQQTERLFMSTPGLTKGLYWIVCYSGKEKVSAAFLR